MKKNMPFSMRRCLCGPVFVLAIFSVCILSTDLAFGEAGSGDTPISLNMEQRPLVEVLAMITKTTGHQFIIDEAWLDMPVSISVEAIPLHTALKLIFADLSNAIVYRSDGDIKIIIYTEAPPKDVDSTSQDNSTAPQPEPPAATEQEPDSPQPDTSDAETDHRDATAETQPAEDAEATDEKTTPEETDNPDAEIVDKQDESTEAVPENQRSEDSAPEEEQSQPENNEAAQP